jgi:RNA recognition motif-containing protein
MRGFAHVEFETAEGVANAIKKAGENVGGRPLRIDKSGGGGGGDRGGRGGFRGGDRGGRGGGGRGGAFGRGGKSDFRSESSGTGRFSGGSGKVYDL